jgi:lipopolysaccharide transport system ATP-binding protein
MSNTVISVENLSKQYRLGQVGTGTISDDLNRWWAKVRGKDDPLLKVGEINDRSKAGKSDYVWSLRDINFEVKQGDTLGIIGKNGAGKSTLLKILSKVTGPSSGSIKVRGRVASLLEVGTGFHPELTGRENIFLNGAILGMKRDEIKAKFDEIVAFSGVERYIDTPVKRYSSGMYVRLAFAVAAHLEPEILIVDEVLAVGDAEFQKKCLGKMKDVSVEGRTVLFVSHNMAAVKSLCNRSILLKSGNTIFDGRTDQAIAKYLGGNSDTLNYRTSINYNSDFEFISLGIKAVGKDFSEPILRNDEIELILVYENKAQLQNIDFTLKFKGDDGNYFWTTTTANSTFKIDSTSGIAKMKIESGFFNEGSFFIDLMIIKDGRGAIFLEADALSFLVNPAQVQLGKYMGAELGYIRKEFLWTTE